MKNTIGNAHSEKRMPARMKGSTDFSPILKTEKFRPQMAVIRTASARCLGFMAGGLGGCGFFPDLQFSLGVAPPPPCVAPPASGKPHKKHKGIKGTRGAEAQFSG